MICFTVMNYIYGARLAKKKQKKQHIHENFGNYINSQYLADHNYEEIEILLTFHNHMFNRTQIFLHEMFSKTIY